MFKCIVLYERWSHKLHKLHQKRVYSQGSNAATGADTPVDDLGQHHFCQACL